MQRRSFITGTMAAAAALALPMAHDSTDCLAAQAELNTFSPNDTLVQRLEKLNALMGTNFTLCSYYPKEWETEEWWTSPRYSSSREYIEASIFSQKSLYLDPRFKHEWGVYLENGGKRWSGNMTALEYLDWTAQVALGYRIAKAQAS